MRLPYPETTIEIREKCTSWVGYKFDTGCDFLLCVCVCVERCIKMVLFTTLA